jgi:hypothetical protein
MSGTRSGPVTFWDDAQGLGRVTEASSVHTLDRVDCSTALQNALQGRTIPPDASVQISFDLDLRNRAINADLAAA